MCLFVTCFTIGTTESLLAATCVGGRAHHVSTAGMSAHGWRHKWHANTNNTWSDSLRQKANTYLPPSVALKHRKRKRIQILYTIPILNVYLSLLIKASCCKSAGDGSVIFLEHYHACCLRFTLSSSFKRSEKYRADLNSWVMFATNFLFNERLDPLPYAL